MAQKINPISLRLGKTNRSFDSSWFNDSNYVNLLMRNLKIQFYINIILKKLKYCSARYSIQNLPNKVKVNIFFCNPDKSRRHMSKIFYLGHTKKTKKSKKRFFNTHQTGISLKQGKIFQYLIKNFNQNLLETTGNSYHDISANKNFMTLSKNIFNLNTILLFKNYLKIISSIKKYNQFHIRYFLIKYFSIKFSTVFFNEKNFHFSSTSPSDETNGGLAQDSLKIIFYSETETEFKQKQNILFFYIMNFLFLKIYKNKNFLALNYFQVKINDYKTVTGNYNDLFIKTPFGSQLPKINMLLKKNKLIFSLRKHEFKNDICNLKFKTESNFLFKTILNNLNSPGLNLYAPFFFNNVEATKLKILNFLKKLELQSKHLSTVANLVESNSNLVNFKILNIPEKKFILTFDNFPAFIKLKDNYKNFKWFNKKNNLINFSFHQRYYDISLINNQCFNETYSNYCKLSGSNQYYNNIFSQYNLHSSNILMKNNKKFTLISPPYKYHIESIICNQLFYNISLNFFKTANIFQNASFFIDEIIYYLEKRVAFFKIKNYILKKLTEQKSLRIKGIRVTCSGRIGGKSKKAQRSKVQNFKYGETSLHVFSSKIDFKLKNAFTSFGTLGIKAWICYN